MGSIPVTTPMLMNACRPIIEVMPAPSRQPKRSRQASDTKPRQHKQHEQRDHRQAADQPEILPDNRKMKSDSG